MIISGRRKICVEYTKAGLNVFSYRFDTPLVSKLETTCNRISECPSVLEVLTSFQWNTAVTAGAQHFVNVVFSFRRSLCILPPAIQSLTTQHPTRKHLRRSWPSPKIPKLHRPVSQDWESVHLVRQWPRSKHKSWQQHSAVLAEVWFEFAKEYGT